MYDVELDYVKRVWHRGPADWCWEVRGRTQGGRHLEFSAHGTATSRQKANAAVLAAVEQDEAQRRASWVGVPR